VSSGSSSSSGNGRGPPSCSLRGPDDPVFDAGGFEDDNVVKAVEDVWAADVASENVDIEGWNCGCRPRACFPELYPTLKGAARDEVPDSCIEG